MVAFNCIYFHIFMPCELFNLNFPPSLHLYLLSPLWQHPLIRSYDLMIIDGIPSSPTLLDLIERPDYFELLN